MSNLTRTVGLVLIVVGVVAYFTADTAHWTALLPAILGLVLVVLGVLGARAGDGSRHYMHAAMVIALLGIIGTLPRAIQIGDGGGAAIASLITLVVLVIYLAVGIRSFVAARRSP